MPAILSQIHIAAEAYLWAKALGKRRTNLGEDGSWDQFGIWGRSQTMLFWFFFFYQKIPLH